MNEKNEDAAVPDAVPDTGPDAVLDARPDAGSNAETDAGSDAEPNTGADKAKEPQEEAESLGSLASFVLKVALAVLVFRSFIFSPFSIPSESMLPSLWNGDYLLAAKWPYGFSKDSLPFSAPLISGKILGAAPERGDVVIFKHPVDDIDYIKRVIALPGDTVQVRAGTVILNGVPLPRQRLANFIVPILPNSACHAAAERIVSAHNTSACSYAQFRETLPSGKSYNVIDLGFSRGDHYGPLRIPEGRVFVMGDNRDNSEDSRFPAAAGGPVGLVPIDNLFGRAAIIVWSSNGKAEWDAPASWFETARWGRVLKGI